MSIDRPIFCAISILTIFVLTSCSPPQKIEGEVKDNFGNSLTGVEVKIQGTTFQAETDESGKYSLDYAPGTFKIDFRKEGYLGTTLELAISEKSYLPAETQTLIKYPEPGVSLLSSDGYYPLKTGRFGQANQSRHSNGYRVFRHKIEGVFTVLKEKIPANANSKYFTFTLLGQNELQLFYVSSNGEIAIQPDVRMEHQSGIHHQRFNMNLRGLPNLTVELTAGRYALAPVDKVKAGFGYDRRIINPVYLFAIERADAQPEGL